MRKRFTALLLAALLCLSLLPGEALANTTPVTGIYMEAVDGAPSGDVTVSAPKDDGNGNTPPTYDLNYSSVKGFTFYYYNAQAEEFVAKYNTANMVSITAAGSNFWKVTLKNGISGNQRLFFAATADDGYYNEFPVDLTDLTPPIPAGVYTAHDGNGGPVLNTRVPEHVNPDAPTSYDLRYTAWKEAVYYYYNEGVTSISTEGNGIAITAKGTHLWEIKLKDGFYGEFPVFLQLSNRGMDIGMVILNCSDGSGKIGGWLPKYIPVDQSAADPVEAPSAVASAELGLKMFFYHGDVYYFGFLGDDMQTGGYTGRDGAIYSMLEPNIYTKNRNYYQPVKGDLRDALESYLGVITLAWYAETGSPAQKAPMRHTCLEDTQEPSEYYWRFADENLGIWYLTATAENLQLTSVAKIKHYKNAEIPIDASDAEELQAALDAAVNNPQADTTYIFRLSAAEFKGYVTIPSELKYVEIHGTFDEQGNNRVTWKGGILTGDAGNDNHMPVLVQRINFVSPADYNTEEQIGEGNAAVPNSAVYGKRAANVMFCNFEGFYHAVDLRGSDSFYVTASKFMNNYTGIYAGSVYGLEATYNRFDRNSCGIWMDKLPATAVINDYILKYNAFIDNDTDIKVSFQHNVRRPFFAPYNYFEDSSVVQGTVCTYPQAKTEQCGDFYWETGGAVCNFGEYWIPMANIRILNPVEVIDSHSGKTVGIWNLGGDN